MCSEKEKNMTTRGITKYNKKKFLEKFAKSGNVSGACREVGISRQSIKIWLEKDPAFVEAYRLAEIEACDALEAEAHRRGAVGFTEPVFYQGVQCGEVRKYSDLLLMFLMKGRQPEKYRDNYQKPSDASLAESLKILAEKLPV